MSTRKNFSGGEMGKIFNIFQLEKKSYGELKGPENMKYTKVKYPIQSTYLRYVLGHLNSLPYLS